MLFASKCCKIFKMPCLLDSQNCHSHARVSIWNWLESIYQNHLFFTLQTCNYSDTLFQHQVWRSWMLHISERLNIINAATNLQLIDRQLVYLGYHMKKTKFIYYTHIPAWFELPRLYSGKLLEFGQRSKTRINAGGNWTKCIQNDVFSFP